MLKDKLYKITLSDHQEFTIHATLELDKNDEIFIGHFPGQPVLPGACMLQMVKEVLENTLTKSLMLTKANQIKFLRLIDPGIDNILQLTITYKPGDNNHINVTATITVLKDICFKFKGIFSAI
ncbi:MAG TPA: 3-hydroxyacyl-ACP dehydratase [Hanamia sp.]